MQKTSYKKRIISFTEKVYNVVKRIPRGKVATYTAVARALKNPRAFRAVGNALNKNPYEGVPCHRVVRSDGFAGGFARGTKQKIKILQKEGVSVINNKISGKFLCQFLP